MNYIIFFDDLILIVGGLLPIANPFSTAPLFMTLTQHLSPKDQIHQANWACGYMAIILITFLMFGALIISFFGISIPGIRIAGGLIIMFLGFRMLFPHEREITEDTEKEERRKTDFAFSPLAMPMLSGPGSIAVILSYSARIQKMPNDPNKLLAIVAAIFGILLTAIICWLVLRASRTVVPYLGSARIDAITKILGFILICIGVQFLGNGIKEFFDI